MAKAGDGQERSDKRRRHHLLQKRVDGDELARFIERAHDAGFLDHRDYLGAFVYGEIEIDRRERHDLIRILGELGKHGSNLNQIAHAANSGKITALSANDLRMIEDTRAAIKVLGSQIREALK